MPYSYWAFGKRARRRPSKDRPPAAGPGNDGAIRQTDAPQKPAEEQHGLMKHLLDELGRDTPLGKATLAQWKDFKSREAIEGAIADSDIQVMRIPLRLLDESPFQLRRQMDADPLAELTASIEKNGLVCPILVRPNGSRYEIIAGHRRAAAYRQLEFLATAEAKKEKYRAIRAIVAPKATDEYALRFALAENSARVEVSPADEAHGLLILRQLNPCLDTAKKLSEAAGLAFKRVERLLRLSQAPEVVLQGVQDGLTVPVEERDGHRAGEQRRRLDLMTAIEFARLHGALMKGGAGKDGASIADERTRHAIKRALRENWGLREVTRYVDKAVAAPYARAHRKTPGRPRGPFRLTRRELIIHLDRLPALGPAQKESLRAIIEQKVFREL